MCLQSLRACLNFKVNTKKTMFDMSKCYFSTYSVFCFMIHCCIITDYTVCKVKMTDIKIIIHQDMLRRTTCALFCGLVASSAQRPLSTEKLCAVYFACLQVLSTVEFEMFSVLWNSVTIEMVRKRELSSPGEKEPRKRNKGLVRVCSVHKATPWVFSKKTQLSLHYSFEMMSHCSKTSAKRDLLSLQKCEEVVLLFLSHVFYECLKRVKLPMHTKPSL